MSARILIMGSLRTPLSLVAMAVVLAGCVATTPQPYIMDFTDDKVRVGVEFNIFGPTTESAQAASDPVAMEQCDSYEKGSELVSRFRQNRTLSGSDGRYVFLYRCVGADTVRIERDR